MALGVFLMQRYKLICVTLRFTRGRCANLRFALRATLVGAALVGVTLRFTNLRFALCATLLGALC